jgi:hypothetical protein
MYNDLPERAASSRNTDADAVPLHVRMLTYADVC